ncbi:MAG: hypothetical protein SOZ09_00930 [Eubacteriales bacterium]|nr:hypothetical protein [Clostridiales bacterium]MDD7773801.1 hypothetical protein [Eubacteriales bacterium]MDY3940532.1 hypothetical protein [Eubacteriales bacterium]
MKNTHNKQNTAPRIDLQTAVDHVSGRKPGGTGNDGNKQKNSTRLLTLSAILSAASVGLLYVGSLTVFDLSMILVCALVTMFLYVEAGRKYAGLYVAVTGLLCLILLPSKLMALTYICIGGVYPILKATFEKFRPLFAWALKLSVLDSMLLLLIVLAKLVFVAEDSYFDFTLPILLGGTVFFIIYDLALTGCVTLYIVKLRRRLGMTRKLF